MRKSDGGMRSMLGYLGMPSDLGRMDVLLEVERGFLK